MKNIGLLIISIMFIFDSGIAVASSLDNNGHGNNCDGIDSSNLGNGSPDGKNPNHQEEYENDEGRDNCPMEVNPEILFAD